MLNRITLAAIFVIIAASFGCGAKTDTSAAPPGMRTSTISTSQMQQINARMDKRHGIGP